MEKIQFVQMGGGSRPGDLPTKVLHYLFYDSDRGSRVGHCLDFDLVVVSKPGDAKLEGLLNSLVAAHLGLAYRDGEFINLCTQAPLECWERFHQRGFRRTDSAVDMNLSQRGEPEKKTTLRIFRVYLPSSIKT